MTVPQTLERSVPAFHPGTPRNAWNGTARKPRFPPRSTIPVPPERSVSLSLGRDGWNGGGTGPPIHPRAVPREKKEKKESRARLYGAGQRDRPGERHRRAALSAAQEETERWTWN